LPRLQIENFIELNSQVCDEHSSALAKKDVVIAVHSGNLATAVTKADQLVVVRLLACNRRQIKYEDLCDCGNDQKKRVPIPEGPHSAILREVPATWPSLNTMP
jgi:hypothetical protein